MNKSSKLKEMIERVENMTPEEIFGPECLNKFALINWAGDGACGDKIITVAFGCSIKKVNAMFFRDKNGVEVLTAAVKEAVIRRLDDFEDLSTSIKCIVRKGDEWITIDDWDQELLPGAELYLPPDIGGRIMAKLNWHLFTPPSFD
jgi:hypothetical protein